ncbi:MAG: hypothetical protein MUD01_11060 [Chloroflexaceae bacterium]|nr:hypothetical protein [Chloroflexaceae bacterium]
MQFLQPLPTANCQLPTEDFNHSSLVIRPSSLVIVPAAGAGGVRAAGFGRVVVWVGAGGAGV